MYQWIFKRKIREGFEDISQGRFEKLLTQFAPEIEFTFPGDHAMAGHFYRRETVRQWFERIHRIFPGLRIEAQNIYVSGFPWNAVVVTRFSARDTLSDGTIYQNQGVQVARIRWGKVVEDHLIEDTQRLSEMLQRAAKLGIAEATATPLKDAG